MEIMEKIRELLTDIIKRVFDVEVEVEVSEPPLLEEQGGFRADVATNVAMKLTGALTKKTGEKKNPREVAERLKEECAEAVKGSELEGVRVEVAGPGFMNFMLPDGYFGRKLGEMVTDFDGNISCDEYAGKTVVTEYSDPNPFKVLHVGHLYTSIVGESISRLIEFAGGEVHRVNFGGDVGLHVAKTLYALRRTALASSASADALLARRTSSTARSATPASLNKSKAEASRESRFTIEDIARAYVEGTRAYEEDETAKAEITKLNKTIYEIAARGEGNYEGLSDEDERLARAYWQGRTLSYEYFDEFYAKIGVKFEKYYPESTVAGRGLETIKSHTPEVYQESDGAVVFRGEDYGLHTRVFVNKEGLPTYEAKDVGLLFQKNEDYGFDESVVITGNDIIDYMKVVLKSVEQYAPELVARTRHITHGNVRLPGNEKMSSRKGNFIKAVDVLESVERACGVTEREEGASISKLALAAVKYSFLKYKIGGNIEFDVGESVSTTGNSGVYLQYSAVRAKRILSNLKTSGEGADEVDGSEPLTSYEIELMKKFEKYQRVLDEAVRAMAPHLVCNFLFELAQEFSRFYENCRVAGDAQEVRRGKMVWVFYKIMEHGLGLLGITVPEEM